MIFGISSMLLGGLPLVSLGAGLALLGWARGTPRRYRQPYWPLSL